MHWAITQTHRYTQRAVSAPVYHASYIARRRREKNSPSLSQASERSSDTQHGSLSLRPAEPPDIISARKMEIESSVQADEKEQVITMNNFIIYQINLCNLEL